MDQAAKDELSQSVPTGAWLSDRSGQWLAVMLGLLLALAAIWAWQQVAPISFATTFPSLTDTDLDQARIDTALPALHENLIAEQAFVPQWNGLTSVEVTLVRYGEDAEAGARFTLELLDRQGTLIAERTLNAADLDHNQILRLEFPPQPDSAGSRYLLRARGDAGSPVAVWGYSLDVYPGGELTLRADGEPQETTARDLRFLTSYELTWRDALQSLLDTLYYEGALFLVALLVLPLPGCLLLLFFHGRSQSEAPPLDPAAWWSVAFALGVAVWPLLWLWLSLLGGRWWGWLLWTLVAVGWLTGAVYVWRSRRRRLQVVDQAGIPELVNRAITAPWRWSHLLLLLILLAGLSGRLLAVRDLAFLPWVDASRHALITTVLTDTGQAIDDYGDFLPVERFPYHYGFHSLAANLGLMTGWPMPRLLLYFGQLLNALVPFAVYGAVWLLVRRRSAALFAAFLVALPFFFPAYYTTWGRMTQLTAVFLLPLLLALSWRLVRDPREGRRLWWLVVLHAAGLFMIHFRVFVYFLPFPLLAWLLNRGRNGRRLAAAGGLALLLVLPRALQLLAVTDPVQRVGRSIPNYNTFPTSYFTSGWELLFVGLAAAALLLVLVAMLLRQRWTLLPLALALWVGLLFLGLAGERLGLPETSLVNLNSMTIILFVPLALFLAVVADRLWLAIAGLRQLPRLLAVALATAALAVTAFFGFRQQVTILNPQTILAEPQDLAALRWVAESVPDDALIAVNSWRWLGETWAAADGGAWLLPLTGLMPTTPPIDHIYNPELFRWVREFNQAATAVTDWSTPDAAEWLREQGVTHVFVGARGGFLDPAALARNPELEMIYHQGGDFVFRVRALDEL